MIKDREKRLQYQKDWYQKNKEDHKKNAAKNRRKQILRNREFLDRYKEKHACQCGEIDPCCLEFHHRDPSEKEDNLRNMANRALSLSRIQKEIDKCDLLCRNCHAKEHRHERMHGWE